MGHPDQVDQTWEEGDRVVDLIPIAANRGGRAVFKARYGSVLRVERAGLLVRWGDKQTTKHHFSHARRHDWEGEPAVVERTPSGAYVPDGAPEPDLSTPASQQWKQKEACVEFTKIATTADGKQIFKPKYGAIVKVEFRSVLVRWEDGKVAHAYPSKIEKPVWLVAGNALPRIMMRDGKDRWIHCTIKGEPVGMPVAPKPVLAPLPPPPKVVPEVVKLAQEAFRRAAPQPEPQAPPPPAAASVTAPPAVPAAAAIAAAPVPVRAPPTRSASSALTAWLEMGASVRPELETNRDRLRIELVELRATMQTKQAELAQVERDLMHLNSYKMPAAATDDEIQSSQLDLSGGWLKPASVHRPGPAMGERKTLYDDFKALVQDALAEAPNGLSASEIWTALKDKVPDGADTKTLHRVTWQLSKKGLIYTSGPQGAYKYHLTKGQ